jgi:ribosomal protein S18 acetylase RimI-like enzyme
VADKLAPSNKAYSIRTAHSGDLAPLLLIEQRCFNSDQINRRQMRYLLTRAKAETLLVVDPSDSAMGYCMALIPELPRPARLYSLAVLPDYRGQRLGEVLLVALLQCLQQKGYHRCTLEVRLKDQRTQALYQRIGFTSVKTLSAYYADGDDAQRMQCQLFTASTKRR